MTGLVVLLMSLGVAGATTADGCQLSATLEAPPSVSRSEPFAVRITVSNTGNQGCLFKQYWKWATNRMFLEVLGPDGAIWTSGPRLFDIKRDFDCFYTKPLGSGDSFSFAVTVNGDLQTLPLELRHVGHLRLSWRYLGDPSTAKTCKIADVFTWTKDLQSNIVDLDVK